MQKLQRYKKTEFGEIPQDWSVFSLREIASKFLSGGTPSTSNSDYWGGEIPWIRSAWLTGKYVSTGERFITKLGLENSSAKIIPKDNVIVATRVSLGNIAINKVDVAINQDVTGIIVDRSKFSTEYLYWTLFKYNQRIKLLSQGSTIPGITRDDLLTISIPCPPLIEQDRIASILSRLDELIQKTDRIIEQTQRLKKGLMQKLLTKGNGSFRRSSSENLEKSESWEIQKIGELQKRNCILEIQDGNHGELYPRKSNFTDQGRPFLSANCITEDGQIDFKKAPKLPEEYCKKLRIGFTKPGDVLFTHNATVGRVAILPKSAGDCIIGTSVTYYRVNEHYLSNKYLAYSLQSSHFKKQLAQVMFQTTRSQVPITAQSKLSIVIPPLEKQHDIANILSGIEKDLKIKKIYRSQVDILKRGLMQNLLTGKIRVKV